MRNVTAVYEKCKTEDLDLKLREVLPNSTCTVKVLSTFLPCKVYTMDNFQRALLSVPTLIKDHKAALFHPEHSVVIANATSL